jgi:light-regulated signal transduction histidine kinase (bacteriophytochrome)
MHPLLRRQLKRHGPVLPDEDPPALWAGLLEAVSAAYAQADEDRRMLERSLELTSTELTHNYEQIEAQKQELQRSNAELESFAYIASHDLQEPLRTVQSYVQLLRKRYADKLDADANEFMGFAVEGVTRMRALIDDLLTYARLASRARPFEQTELDEVLAEVLRGLQVRLDEKHAKIEHAELPAVMGDRRQLGQLFQNLIANAVKFHKPGAHPTVKIEVEPREVEYVITIADDGIGIAAEYREKIFVIFQRLHSRDEYDGTGLGLAVCKKIVERHGGKIWVESEPGHGARFRFTIPK